jgi:hypothetical protein
MGLTLYTPRVTTGELITRWTVRIALLLYFAAIALLLSAPRRDRAARLLYCMGCLVFLAHVAAAFHFAHHWSHDAAYVETAQQTRELTGLDSGIGLWLNYLFTLVWLSDAIAWSRGVERYRGRSKAITISLHAFMLFMIFNATVVFETGATRWTGVAATAAIAVLAVRAHLQKRHP